MHNYIVFFLLFTSFIHSMEYREENGELIISWLDSKEFPQKKDTLCHEDNCFMCIYSKKFSTAKPNMLPFDSKTIYTNASYEAYFRTLCSCKALLKGSTIDKLKMKINSHRNKNHDCSSKKNWRIFTPNQLYVYELHCPYCSYQRNDTIRLSSLINQPNQLATHIAGIHHKNYNDQLTQQYIFYRKDIIKEDAKTININMD